MNEKEQLEKSLDVAYKEVSDASEKVKKIKTRLNEIEFGFKTGDIIEYEGHTGEAEVLGGYGVHFFKYKKDGNLSMNRSYIYNEEKVKIVKRKEG